MEYKPEFIEKNNILTVSVNGIKLHSAYNPENEAKRFAESIKTEFIPEYIAVTEPALSYCASEIKKLFPEAKLICIRYTDIFDNWNKVWDKVFYPQENLDQLLFNYMGEQGLSNCIFLSWKSSEKVFEKEYVFVWNKIRDSVLKARTVIGTSAYFAKRWAKNTLRLSFFAKKLASIQPGNCPVIMCASGPSLKNSFDELILHRKEFFLIAVSSALLPLVSRNIIPDLCISTDGGFWATQHLAHVLEKYNIPLALASEGNNFAHITSKITIIPLFYGDGISEDILKSTSFIGNRAIRNGSVSGTAAYFSLSITSGNVYCLGLDLEASKGFVHTQPNQLEINDSIKDCRTAPMETRIASTSLKYSSLDIYKSWFCSTNFNGRLFRLKKDFNYNSSLGTIKDVEWKDFEKNESATKKIMPSFSNKNQNKIDLNLLEETVKNHLDSEEWIRNALPAEYINLQRTPGNIKGQIKIQIKEKMSEFANDILKSVGKK